MLRPRCKEQGSLSISLWIDLDDPPSTNHGVLGAFSQRFGNILPEQRTIWEFTRFAIQVVGYVDRSAGIQHPLQTAIEQATVVCIGEVLHQLISNTSDSVLVVAFRDVHGNDNLQSRGDGFFSRFFSRRQNGKSKLERLVLFSNERVDVWWGHERA